IEDKCERMLLLYNKFVEDNIVSTGDRAVKPYTETLWQLIEELTSAFNSPDPKQHNLFKHVQELNPAGYTRMFNFYRTSLGRLYNILHEEVYKTKKVTKGRRVKELVNVSAKQYLLTTKEN
ncbi:8653_t:CDS:1, partial [Scutellospora calospora]